MADTLLGTMSQRLGTRRSTVKPCAEAVRVRPCPFPGVDGHEKRCISPRELSLGCFSETNQKRLTKDSPIEIYRARLPGSARLVVCHPFGIFVIEGLDVFTSIILMSSTSMAKMYGLYFLPHRRNN